MKRDKYFTTKSDEVLLVIFTMYITFHPVMLQIHVRKTTNRELKCK